MKIYLLYNLKPKTDLSRISSKNILADELVKPIYKFVKQITKTSSNVWEPKTYNKIINDPIYGNKQHETIDKKLQNLDTYQT